jgi:rhamnosyltransferase
MRSFGLIFVLYHPTEEFLENLFKARAVCKNLVAVDNSPEADLHLHQLLREQGMQVLFNHNEGGLAGAYNRGTELLLDQQCEVIFLLDQDSDIDASFFEDMLRDCNALGVEEFLVGPKVYEVNLQSCMPAFQREGNKGMPKRVRIDDEVKGMIPALFVISSGSAFSASAYRKLGPFREDYFIEYIDIEYGLRAVSQNVPVYMNAAVTMRQTTGKIERHGKTYTTNHAAGRRYYGARNAVHCIYIHRKYWGPQWVSTLLTVLQVLRVLQYEPQKLKKVTAILCGYGDGIFGRLGSFEERHPHIAAFCNGSKQQKVLAKNSTPDMAQEEQA